MPELSRITSVDTGCSPSATSDPCSSPCPDLAVQAEIERMHPVVRAFSPIR